MASVVSAVKTKQANAEDPAAGRALKLVAMAEIDRNRHLRRIEDCYKYGLPWRHKANQNQPVDQLDEIFDEELMTVLEDFAADMLNTFTPQKAEWVEPKPVARLDAGDQRQIAQALSNYKDVIFGEMARSNLYQALQEAYVDLGPGTMCMVITDIDPAQPIHCEAIPCVDLLLNRGCYGRIDGTWRKRRRLESDIPILWPEARKDDGQEFDPASSQEHDVIDGVYRDHTARAAETWVYVVLVDSKLAWKQVYQGRGSNPFIVARWSRDATTAWGVGPTYRTVPSVKTLNHFRFLSLKNYDKIVDPPVSYEDDGVINIDQGVGPGDWIPRAKDSEKPSPIESASSVDAQIFQIDEVRAAIRRAHYQDRPEQTGKTPPTATQWADEAAERARRMGTPATNLVIEWQYPIFQRFAYLLEKRGLLPKVELQGKEIALEPISPLLRAQQEEEVVRMDRYAGLLQQRFGPEMTALLIDATEYAKALASKMGIDPKIPRDPKQLQSAIEQFAPVLGGGGAAPEPPA